MSIATVWRPQDTLDKEMALHMTYVGNQILQTVRKEGVTKGAVEHCGMMLLRLYTVWKAYCAKKKTVSAGEWLLRMTDIVDEARKL